MPSVARWHFVSMKLKDHFSAFLAYKKAEGLTIGRYPKNQTPFLLV